MRKILFVGIAVLMANVAFTQVVYTFTGNGNWTVSTNWSKNTIPPVILPAGSTIDIHPKSGDTCLLNITQTISPGASLNISAGAIFLIPGGLNVLGAVPTITTKLVTSITSTTATSGGNISANGGSPITISGVVWSTSPNPSLNLSTKTTDGTSAGSFNSQMNALQIGTLYYVRAYATNSLGTAYGNAVSFTTLAITPCSSVTDIDGNLYSAVSIGTQCWTTKNLDVSTYRNGDAIPQVTDPTQWTNLTTGAWCYYDNDTANRAIYGKLYNWYAVNDPRGLAPAGWHVPSDTDWTNLTTFLGGDAFAGGAMKSTTGWNAPNTGATNSSEFTGLPGGDYNNDGIFYHVGSRGFWWSATEGDTLGAWYRYLITQNPSVNRSYVAKEIGFSVRCIRN